MRSRMTAEFCFWVSLVLIVAISGYDTYMTVQLQENLISRELNPLAKYLLVLDDGKVSLLLGCKVFGTSVTAISLAYLRLCKYRYLWVVTSSLLFVQTLVVLSYFPVWNR